MTPLKSITINVWIKHWLGVMCMLLVVAPLTAQNDASHFTEEVRFARYLIQHANYREALHVLDHNVPVDSSLGELQKDTLHYLKGWSYYNLKQTDSAAHYLRRVSPAFHQYDKARYYGSFSLIHNRRLHHAIRWLDTIQSDTLNPRLTQLSYLQEAGIHLLARDYAAFSDVAEQFTFDYHPLAREQTYLTEYHTELTQMRKKSPWLAGMMSAVIPGSGKLYAGYPGQAASSFLTVATFGAVTAEAYYRDGIRSAPFIISAVITSVFYAGNIWGSVLSVNIKRQERYDEIDHNIMLDMHIPLRRIF